MSSHIHILPNQTIKSPMDLNYSPMPSTFEGVQSNFLRTSSDNSQYNSADTIQIRLRNNGNLMDVDNSYLSMRVNLTGENFGASAKAVTGFNMFAGVWGLISGIKMTASNGTVILNVPQNFDYFMAIVNEYLLDLGNSQQVYNNSHAGVLFVDDDPDIFVPAEVIHCNGADSHFRFTQGVEPCQVSPASWHTSNTANVNINVNQFGYAYNHTDRKYVANVGCKNQMNSVPVNTEHRDKVYIINPLGIFFQHGSLLPLFTDYNIELHLNNIETGLRKVPSTHEANATQMSTSALQSFNIKNVKFVAKNIMLPQQVSNQLVSLWETRGLHLTLTNILPIPINSHSNTQVDTLRINAGGKRNITGLIFAPRATCAINNIAYDSYRRCKPDFNRIDLRVGDMILEPIESDTEAFNHVRNFFDNNVKSVDVGCHNGTYGSLEKGYFCEDAVSGLYQPGRAPVTYGQNIDTNATGFAGTTFLVTEHAKQRIFSSWICAYDMSTFEDKSLNSGVSLTNIELSYNLRSAYSGTSSIQNMVFLLYGSIMRLSKANVCEVFT